jgi:hypothetical protein
MNDDYFGTCPHCHHTDGYINVGKHHWFLCDKHKVKWFVGSNLFSSWRRETIKQQRAAYEARGVGAYTEVAPYLPPPRTTIRAHSVNEGGPAGENTAGFVLTIDSQRFEFPIEQLAGLISQLKAIRGERTAQV